MRMVISLLFLLLAQNVLAQTTDWQTLTTDDDEFTIQMPAGCYTYFYNKDGITVTQSYTSNRYALKDMQLLSCYHDGTLLSVEIYSTDDKKGALKALIDNSGERGDKGELKIGKNFYGREYGVNNQTYSRTSRYIASKKRLYVTTTASRTKDSELMKRFLDSVQLNDNPVASGEQKNVVLISTLKSVEPEVSFQEQLKDKPKPVAPTPPARPTDEAGLSRMIVLMSPRASYTDAARQNNLTGVIRLRMTFAANGNISKIIILAPLGDGLLRNAALSAVRMKFLPEERDNQPVSTTKTVEYGFNIY